MAGRELVSSWEPGGAKLSVCTLQDLGESLRALKKMKKTIGLIL